MQREDPDRLTVVAHSQGTMLAIDVLAEEGAFLRKGQNTGLASLEEALLAIALSQSVLGLTDKKLEKASGVNSGTLRRLRHGKGYSSSLEKITGFLESCLEKKEEVKKNV